MTCLKHQRNLKVECFFIFAQFIIQRAQEVHAPNFNTVKQIVISAHAILAIKTELQDNNKFHCVDSVHFNFLSELLISELLLFRYN